jgi:hypothetical protein
LAATSPLAAVVPVEVGPVALDRAASVSAVGRRGFVRGTGSSVGTATESTGATPSACVALHGVARGGSGAGPGSSGGDENLDTGPTHLVSHEARAVHPRERGGLVLTREDGAQGRRIGRTLRAGGTDRACAVNEMIIVTKPTANSERTVTTPALARS